MCAGNAVAADSPQRFNWVLPWSGGQPGSGPGVPARQTVHPSYNEPPLDRRWREGTCQPINRQTDYTT